MHLSVGNHITTITKASEEEHEWAEELLSISEPVFRKDYRTGRMVQSGSTVHCFVKNKKFPSGFVRLLHKASKREGYILEIEDVREPLSKELVDLDCKVVHTFEEEKPLIETIRAGKHVDPWLRYYQKDAIDAVVKRKRGILWHTTAAGKTSCAVALTIRIPVEWLFIVQDKALLHNAADRYEELTGRQPKIIGDGKVDLSGDGNFIVAMAQTLDRRRNDKEIWNLVRSVEGLIIDECHGTPAAQIGRITNSTEKAVYRVGLSGTPFDRSDSKGLATIGALGTVIHRVKADELIERGFISRADIKMVKHDAPSRKPTYQGAYGDLIVRSTSRNKLIVDILKATDKPGLCFVKQINHGKELLKVARRAGINCGFIWGDKNTKQRDAEVEKLLMGEYDILICNVIFQQGVDIPELRSIVRASAGKSTISNLQSLGRGMRVTPTKDSFQYWDIYDTGNKWMESHAKQRRKSLEREGHTVQIIESM